MRITLIGSGNVATVLGRKIFQSGHIIQQVFSRDHEHAGRLAEELSASSITDIHLLEQTADLYIVAVPDDALQNIHESLKLGDRLVVHTAGSVSIDILDKVSSNFGVLYPLQTLRKELSNIPYLPVLVDASNAWNKTKLMAFAQSFADTVTIADDIQRSRLHLAAVITNNFSNHLFALTEQYCESEEVDFNKILPLLDETVKRLYLSSAVKLQTGPAIRKDVRTTHKHQEMLKEHPRLLKMYELFTESIGNSETTADSRQS